MIAYIKGTIGSVTDQSVILENNGIGYIIGASAATLTRLPPEGESAMLHTYMQVKEDDMSLFGFLSAEDLQLFRLLISISGIGPKVGMAILGTMSADMVLTAIASQDSAAFSRVPGVGKKTAQRITLELQDKINTGLNHLNYRGTVMSGVSDEKQDSKQDSIEALLSLGYSRSESVKAVLAVAQEDMSTEQIISLALKKLA